MSYQSIANWLEIHGRRMIALRDNNVACDQIDLRWHSTNYRSDPFRILVVSPYRRGNHGFYLCNQ